ncbi:MAG: hypothetical protein RMK57_11180 [Bryobacterales bacterium]|nr:hypothetical protein [Bryobacteraceae bacterium]MDW8355082.1 hypothetical protein [Bryobacterales bacterium]
MPLSWEHHIEEEDLELYSLGRLSGSREEAVEEHLLVCETCQDRLAETDAYVLAMRTAAAKLAEEPPPLWRQWLDRLGAVRWAPKPVWAAAGAVATLLIAWGGLTWWLSAPTGAPPVAVPLYVVRGEDSGIARAPAGRPLRLEAEVATLPPAGRYAFELVNADGDAIGRWTVAPEADRVAVVVSALSPGRYWVRLYAAGSGAELLREYGLDVR